MRFNVKVHGTKVLISTVSQEVKRDRMGLYNTLYECGEGGCNYECQCESYFNTRHSDMKLCVLYEAG